MDLITAFEEGKVEGITGVPEKIIETWQSKLFFYGEDVYKVYKYERNQFVDFGESEARKNFYRRDFDWNNFWSPSVYLSLQSMKESDGLWIAASDNEARDFCIFMKRIDEKDSLNVKLKAKSLSVEDIQLIISELPRRTKEFTRLKRNELKDVLSRDWKALFSERLEETRQFAYSASEHIERSMTDEVISSLLSFLNHHPYFQSFSDDQMEIAIDNHSDNIYFVDGKLVILDVVMTQRTWRVAEPIFNICRMGMDMAALGGREYAKLLYEKYRKQVQDFPPAVGLFYELYNAFLKAAYLYLMNDKERAGRYTAFVRNNIKMLKV